MPQPPAAAGWLYTPWMPGTPRRAVEAPDEGGLGARLGEGDRGGNEHRGVHAPGCHDLARLVAAPVALDVQSRVLARRAVEPDVGLVLDHLAIAADVEPARVGIARDDRIRGPDVAPAVAGPVAGGREDRHVDVVAVAVVGGHRRLAGVD